MTQAKVYADWRGQEKSALFEERDLPATIDVNAVSAKVLERVFTLSPKNSGKRRRAGTQDKPVAQRFVGCLSIHPSPQTQLL